jgi:very-short-patch-repair endonuclease
MAAVLACGRSASSAANGNSTHPQATRTALGHWGAALSHRSAAEHWRLLPPREGTVHVSVAGIAGKEQRAGVHVHRSRTLGSRGVTIHRGIPVTTAARTIADLRRAATTRGCPATVSPRELRRAIRQADFVGLEAEGEAVTRRTRSDLELAFLAICSRRRLPQPEVNVWIGTTLIDFLWRNQQLVVETDGYAAHRGKAAFEGDRSRDLRLRELGYDVIRLSEQQVDEEPKRVAALLRGALRQGGDPELSNGR